MNTIEINWDHLFDNTYYSSILEELSKNTKDVINWDDIEERLAHIKDKPDCIPRDIREWTHFREQYENCVKWMSTNPIKNLSIFPEFKFKFKLIMVLSEYLRFDDFCTSKKLEISCLGYGYKHSIFEVLNDNYYNLIPELNWALVYKFNLIFESETYRHAIISSNNISHIK